MVIDVAQQQCYLNSTSPPQKKENRKGGNGHNVFV